MTIVNIEVAELSGAGVTVVGDQVAKTPRGSPNAAGVTGEENPSWLCTVKVNVAICPCVMVSIVGAAEMVNEGLTGAITWTVREP